MSHPIPDGERVVVGHEAGTVISSSLGRVALDAVGSGLFSGNSFWCYKVQFDGGHIAFIDQWWIAVEGSV